ncbi:uncharacterized protein VP01_515g10 [Puccinia sorghi]|uniref:Integrase catalytic domain-containing protein n=1 Tax=Puccinia sorghi TaxID=27349 RepID=A0A0L6UKY8_9BASI|nr:uncharacterized protein VP01_515g10 [Puccinia sorghi]
MKIKNESGSITLNNVYYSPNATCTLLSAETLRLGGGKLHVNDLGNVSVSFPNGFTLQSFSVHRRGQIPAVVILDNPPVVFVPPIKPAPSPKYIDCGDLSITLFSASLKESDALMWHRQLGHISLKCIIKMCSAGDLPGLPSKLTNKDFICEDCLVSKSKRQRGNRLSDRGELESMDVIVSDVLGPFVKGFSGVQRYIECMERLTGKKLKVFWTDGGGEFTSKVFLDWLDGKGISHQHSMLYEPEQKGAAERLHWTVGDMARTTLVASGLPVKFWGFAYLWGYFTHNRLVNSITGDKTPLELMFGKKPLYDQLRSFGEVAFVHKPDIYRKGKTNTRAWR